MLAHSGQAYVGAFLRKSAVAPPGPDAPLQAQALREGEDAGGGAGEGSGGGALLDSDIQQVGTFCQVHHISEMESGSAQLLLLGHRRLRRTRTVRRPCCGCLPLLSRLCTPCTLHAGVFSSLQAQPGAWILMSRAVVAWSLSVTSKWVAMEVGGDSVMMKAGIPSRRWARTRCAWRWSTCATCPTTHPTTT
jgi:hypothetical protein